MIDFKLKYIELVAKKKCLAPVAQPYLCRGNKKQTKGWCKVTVENVYKERQQTLPDHSLY